MKVWRYVVFSLMVSFFILGGGICCKALADEGLPDGFKILKERMEKKEIPDADFAKFKFHIPEAVPDEINNLKSYLWSGQHIHPVYKAGRAGAVAYLFLINFNKETGDMVLFRAWEKVGQYKPGWTIMTGKVSPESKGKIELKTKDGNPFILLIKDKDHLTLSSPGGYDADMKKIGTISPPPK
jgi:hypothetical protein